MSEKYRVLLRSAADELRAAERSRTRRERDAHLNRAKAYRILAENEQWLADARLPQAQRCGKSAARHACSGERAPD